MRSGMDVADSASRAARSANMPRAGDNSPCPDGDLGLTAALRESSAFLRMVPPCGTRVLHSRCGVKGKRSRRRKEMADAATRVC